MESVRVERDVTFAGADGQPLSLDVYRPPAGGSMPSPVAIIVAGYPDAGVQKYLGCRFKDMAATSSWARLIAATGITTLTYANRAPADDANALLRHIVSHDTALAVDASRVGLWASSGNVPLALSLLLDRSHGVRPTCAALCYGYMFDDGGSSAVSDNGRQFGFVTPAAAGRAEDLPPTPLFLARAGRDQFPGLNDSIDRFVTRALAGNHPLTVVNHPTGPHAFDLFDDSETTRNIVRQVLAFLRFHLQSDR
jgi:hypothetical protein